MEKRVQSAARRNGADTVHETGPYMQIANEAIAREEAADNNDKTECAMPSPENPSLRSEETGLFVSIKSVAREAVRAFWLVAIYANPVMEFKHYVGLYINHGKERKARAPETLEARQSCGDPALIMRTGRDGLPYVMEDEVANMELRGTSLYYKKINMKASWHIPENQFALMEKLHEIAPDEMAQPIALVRGKGGEALGYLMERVIGVPLEDALASGSLTERQKEKIWKSLSEAVGKFHSNGLGHGDLNMGNVMVTRDFKVKLIDPLDDTVWNRWLSIKEDLNWLDYIHARLGVR